MMISPSNFISEIENENYEKLLEIRDELLKGILYFEKNREEFMKDEVVICPSPDVEYQCNLQYLGELCKLISEKFNEEYE